MCIGIGAVLGIAGGLVSGFAAYQQQQAQADMYEAQADQAKKQAILEHDAGGVEANRLTGRADRLVAQQFASFASAGIDPTAGSAAAVINDTAAEADLDIQAIAWNTEIRAQNERYDAEIKRFNAGRARAAAPLAFLAPVIRAGATAFA